MSDLRHNLTRVDFEGKTADCSVCGPTSIHVPPIAANRLCIARYRSKLEKNLGYELTKRRAQGALPNRHLISTPDLEIEVGHCSVCGPGMDIKRRTTKGKVWWQCVVSWEQGRSKPYALSSGHGLTRTEAKNFVTLVGVCQNPGCGKILQLQSRSIDGGQVDHDHATGVIRGVLCGACNRALGVVSDSVGLLLGLVEYLKNPPGYRRFE